MISGRGEYAKIGYFVVILVAVFMVNNGAIRYDEKLGYYFSGDTKAMAAGNEGVVWFFTVKPLGPAGVGAEGVKVFTDLATEFCDWFPAIVADGFNAGCFSFSGFGSGEVQNFPDSHAGDFVFCGDLNHGDKKNGIVANDVFVLGLENFVHNAPWLRYT